MLEWLPELIAGSAITGERFMVMFELALQPEISLKNLADSLLVSPSSMSVMINSLVEQGLVTRVADPKDRRRVVLRLSDQGAEELRRTEDGLLARYQGYLLELDEPDRRELNEAAATMLKVARRLVHRPR